MSSTILEAASIYASMRGLTFAQALDTILDVAADADAEGIEYDAISLACVADELAPLPE